MKMFIAVLFMLLFAGCKQEVQQENTALTQTETRDFQKELLDDYFQALTEMGQFNGVVYVKKDDSVLLYKAYNTLQYEVATLKVTPESRFDLRSVAKLFAKASLLEMEQEGSIDLGATVSDYIEGLPWGEQVTLKQLMDHTSGLPRELSVEKDKAISLSREQVIDLIRRETLEFEPGTDTLYSNPGYQLLYYLIGKKEDASFPEVLRKRFFKPANMMHSGGHFYDSRSNLKNYGYGHYLKNDSLVAIRELEGEDMRMGHLYSTVSDMSKFLNHLARSEIRVKIANESVITHAGGTRGKRAWVYADLNKNFQIVFLSNIDMMPFQNLTNDLIRIMEGEEVAIPKPLNRKGIAINPDLLKAYAGTYDFTDAGHLILEFRVENDSLALYQKNELGGMLIPENDSVFFSDPKSAESIMFKKDEEGEFKAYMDFQGVRWEGIKLND